MTKRSQRVALGSALALACWLSAAPSLWAGVAPLGTAESSENASAVVEPAGSDAERLQAAKQQAAELLAERIAGGLPGFSIAIAKDGEVLWAAAAGHADVAGDLPMTVDTQVRIGSTSKAITSVLAGRLADAGLVDLAGAIALPEDVFPSKEHDITLLHLLSNQAGIRHYQGAEYISSKHYTSLADGLAIFREDPLKFEPGTEFSYSSYGFNLAAVVLEQAAKNDFAGLLHQWVTEPLGLAATVIDDPTVERPQRAAFYSRGGDEPKVAMTVDDSYKAPSGGILSTPTDMVRFGSAVLAPGFLTEERLQQLSTPRLTSAGKETGYALGWRVHAGSDSFPFRALHHGGSSMGARSMLVVVPETGIVVSLLCNASTLKNKEQDAFALARWFGEATAPH